MPRWSQSDSNYQLVIAKYSPKTDYEEGDKYVQFTGKNVIVVEVTCILDEEKRDEERRGETRRGETRRRGEMK